MGLTEAQARVFPTLGQLRLATAEDVLLWNLHLPSPSTNLEEAIIDLITDRIRQMDYAEYVAAVKNVGV